MFKFILAIGMFLSLTAFAVLTNNGLYDYQGRPLTTNLDSGTRNPLDTEILFGGSIVDPRARTWTLLNTTDSVNAVQSGTWTVQQGTPPWSVSQSGTWTTGRTWTLSSGTDSVSVVQSTSPWVSNITQFGSNNVVTGTGASGLGIPRVTVSNDSNVLVTQSGTWTVQQGTPPWSVVGNVASGSADSGNPVKIGLVYNSTLPTPSSGNRVDAQGDLNGRQLVASAPLDGYKATYTACSGSFALATTPTDVYYLQGSATKTIRVIHADVNGSTTAGSGVLAQVSLIKRSTANTGGTTTAITILPHDSNNSAATATSVFYTANPTALGTSVGTLRSIRDNFTSAGTPGTIVTWDFGITPGQAEILRGTSQYLVVNFNGTTVTGGNVDICLDFTEE